MGNKRVASAEGPSAVPNKRTKRAKNPRDSMHKALDNFKRFPDKPDYEDHQEEQALYKALSHKTQDLRVKGAVAISKALIGQSGDEEPVAPTITEEELKRHMEAYLFPALSQGHAVSREGTFRVLSKVFAALIGDRALTASQYPSLTFDQLLEMLVRHTPLDDESAAGEDQELGRLLGVQCLAQPDILSKDAQRWKELLPLLLELAVKNLELQLACGSIIANVVETLDKTDATLTINAVSESSIANTPEGLAIWVAALTQHPDLKSKTWKKPVSTKSSSRLTSILKESATKVLNENGPGSDNGKITWTAPLHFVWSKLAAHFGSVGDDALRDFTSLWNPIVEGKLGP
ncbi:hypothetical protein IMZ48_21340 [Candidatus Bathyarchaeota archaeon]|nr:hypothetical protein [Candidatus Bathyarchaeota archaeon]